MKYQTDSGVNEYIHSNVKKSHSYFEGFVGKAPPKVPVIKMNLQSPRNKVQEKQPSQQVS